MSKNQSKNKYNYITKINKVNINTNKTNHLVTKNDKMINNKINKGQIFTKSILLPKKGNNNSKNKNNIVHKKILSNIEDYNKLVKLNISNQIKKISENKIKNPIHRRMNTERTIFSINNIRKRNGNHFVLINTRNKKNDNNYRFITEYFNTQNNEESKDFNNKTITKKNFHNNNNSLSIDFNETLAGRLKHFENSKNFISKNNETINKKRFIKYLKANNLYNHSLDNTYSNLIFQKNDNIESFYFNKIYTNTTSSIKLNNYRNNLDTKKKIIFRNNIRAQRDIFRIKIFNTMQKKYSDVLTERTLFKNTLKKYFVKRASNLTIDSIFKENSKKRYKNAILKKRNESSNINAKSNDEYYLTTQNSYKKIKSPDEKKTIKDKNKKNNLWNLKISLDKNSKLKITKMLKQDKNINDKISVIKKVKTIFSITKKGFWQPGVDKPNQDSLFIFKNFDVSNNLYIGVCDGHGKYGKEVSSYISSNLPINLNKNILQSKLNINNDKIMDISQIITKTFLETNATLKNKTNINTSVSGSTCSSVILTQNRIISINLGDSRCVLGKYNKKNNAWLYNELTKDHKASDETETERVIKKGGKIYKEKDEFGNKKGIMRIWDKEEGNVGLALTRSFGDDILSKKGVICEPDIKEFLLEKEDKFIIIGSDGLWEYISNQECINIVKDFFLKNDIKGAGNYLYKEASKRWIMEQDIVDDISIIIIFFDN